MRAATSFPWATALVALGCVGLSVGFGACGSDGGDATTQPTTTTTTTQSTSSGGGGTTGTGGGSGGTGGSASGACTDCHGNAANAAPPVDMNGNDDTSLPTVGSHQEHLRTSTWRHVVECTECHTLPLTTACPDPDSNHCNNVIDMQFGPLANTDGAVTAYSTTTYVCTNNYCHGVTLEPDLGGSSIREPVFNLVDGSQSACGTACHTNPPGSPHDDMGLLCADSVCHGMVIASYDSGANPPTATWVDATRHIDGIVDYVP
jgi:hypothetical protein